MNLDELTLGQIKQLKCMLGGQDATSATDPCCSRKVLVRAYSGVFYGTLVARRGGGSSCEVDLKDVRHIHSWNSEGLPRKATTVEDIAEIGVGRTSNLSGVCSFVTVFEVRAIANCSDVAAKIIEAIGCK